MKKISKIGFLISIISGITVLAAVVSALVVIFTKKRKENEELEKYLDCSIQ